MPTAIVTGGNSGIGRAIATTLAERGFDVGITWHSDEENTEETLAAIRDHGVKAEARRMDADVATDELPQQVAVVGELVDALGGIDVMVNNAGGGLTSPFLEIDLELWQRNVNLNLTQAFLCGQLAARRMVEQGRGGRIVNITSVHEHVPLPDSSPYVACKHGLGGLTKNMALELADHGITVNAVAPGEIATRMTGQEDQDPSESERPGIPLERPGDANEIASCVAWLASPDARYATGQSFVIDGGMLLMAAAANQLAST